MTSILVVVVVVEVVMILILELLVVVVMISILVGQRLNLFVIFNREFCRRCRIFWYFLFAGVLLRKSTFRRSLIALVYCRSCLYGEFLSRAASMKLSTCLDADKFVYIPGTAIVRVGFATTMAAIYGVF